MVDNVYSERKLLRGLDKIWSKFESAINRITQSKFNPLYYLDTLAIYLLIVITVTGVYLTLVYRPGAEVAYASIERISANWFGSLMRSIHRYASDAFFVVALGHAVKIFVSDRFSGARWLAWVSGWALIILTWAIGTMGFWLIWDQRAQWMTEFLINNAGGGVAITFLNPNMASTSFAAFVVVLFVHIFLPLALLLLIIVHVLRLTRAKIWSPRWVMVLSTVALTVLSLVYPTVSEAPANLSAFIQDVNLDALYLGFLPLVEQVGTLMSWTILVLVFGVTILLPWIAKSKQNGPAYVIAPDCTGCALCANECPYRALEMHYREDDGTPYKSIVVINEDFCTGCGLCVGTCATIGIELTHIPTRDFYNNGMLSEVQAQVANQQDPVVVFTCERHASLGSMPESLFVKQRTPDAGFKPAPVYLGDWEHEGQAVSTVTGVVPCVGMVDVDWIKELTKTGAKDVVMLGCPYDDCNYREGIKWESNRLRRRKAVMQPTFHWGEAAPTSLTPITDLLKQTTIASEDKVKPEIEDSKLRHKGFPKPLLAGLLVLMFTLTFAATIPMEFASSSALAEQSQLRVLLSHSGNVSGTANSGVNLPEGATVDMAQILGGERYPVAVELWVDGELVFEDTFAPRGLRKEGEINGMGTFTLDPGTYQVELRIKDDDAEWRAIYVDEVEISAAQIITFIYDQVHDIFILN